MRTWPASSSNGTAGRSSGRVDAVRGRQSSDLSSRVTRNVCGRPDFVDQVFVGRRRCAGAFAPAPQPSGAGDRAPTRRRRAPLHPRVPALGGEPAGRQLFARPPGARSCWLAVLARCDRVVALGAAPPAIAEAARASTALRLDPSGTMASPRRRRQAQHAAAARRAARGAGGGGARARERRAARRRPSCAPRRAARGSCASPRRSSASTPSASGRDMRKLRGAEVKARVKTEDLACIRWRRARRFASVPRPSHRRAPRRRARRRRPRGRRTAAHRRRRRRRRRSSAAALPAGAPRGGGNRSEAQVGEGGGAVGRRGRRRCLALPRRPPIARKASGGAQKKIRRGGARATTTIHSRLGSPVSLRSPDEIMDGASVRQTAPVRLDDNHTPSSACSARSTAPRWRPPPFRGAGMSTFASASDRSAGSDVWQESQLPSISASPLQYLSTVERIGSRIALELRHRGICERAVAIRGARRRLLRAHRPRR